MLIILVILVLVQNQNIGIIAIEEVGNYVVWNIFLRLALEFGQD